MSTLSKARFLTNEKRLLIALRSVVALVLVAFFVSRPAHFETPWQFWFTLALYALTNVVLFFEELKVLRLPRSHFFIFAFDVAMISVLMIFLGERSSEFYVVFFMTIFVAAASKSTRYAFAVSLMMSALYWFVASRGVADILPFSSAFLTRVVFFFIVSMFVGYLSEEAETRRKTAEQLAKRARKAEDATRVVKAANVAKEERLRVLFERAPDGYYVSDLKGVLVDGNRAAEELTGYRREELIGKSFLKLKLLSAGQIPKAAALLAKNALGLSTGPDEFVLNRKDETRVNVEIRTFPVKVAGESLVLGIARDITERKRGEEAERQYVRDMEYLSRTALEFAALSPEEDIYEHMATRLKEIAGDSLVFVNSFDEGTRLIRCRAVAGLGKYLDKVLKLIGRSPVGMSFPISEEADRELRTGRLAKVPGGLYVLALGQIPEEVCRVLERLLGIGDIYAIGVAREGTIFGSASIVTRARTEPKNKAVIETFVNQASVALQRRRAEEALLESEERYRVSIESAPYGIAVVDRNQNGKMLIFNPQLERITGHSKEEIPDVQTWLEKVYPDEEYRRAVVEEKKTIVPQERPRVKEAVLTRKDRENRTCEFVSNVLPSGLRTVFVNDITERRRAEEAVRTTGRFLVLANKHTQMGPLLREFVFAAKELTRCAAVGIRILDKGGNIPYQAYEGFSRRFYELESPLSIKSDQCMCINVIKGTTYPELPFYTKGGSFYMNGTTRFLARVSEEEKGRTRNACNEFGYESVALVPIRVGDQVLGIVHVADPGEDMVPLEMVERLENVAIPLGTAIERIRVQQDLRQTLEQLRQSQKTEAVGRLAGGIAHDFNNLLTAVTGYSELLLDKLDTKDSLRGWVEKIRTAGRGAAELTAQLLAFSRRQVLRPMTLDLANILAETDDMLSRLIGEDIELSAFLEPGLACIKADRTQIEQTLINLAVNARDAMPDGGKLTVEASNVKLGEEHVRRGWDVAPGAYVMLAVTDTGCGMDKGTLEQIFDPFFTTKEVGKGTGLGLSTVYGIVKQSGGDIRAYSELGHGTTIKMCLPWATERAESEEAEPESRTSLAGAETILLAEDDAAVRELAGKILTEYGYSVLVTSNGDEALQLCQKHKGTIHLLLTDVVMPGMSGRQLAERLAALHPETKVLYMSGYTDDAIVQHGVLEPGTPFIGKPFTSDSLPREVRQVLDMSPEGK